MRVGVIVSLLVVVVALCDGVVVFPEAVAELGLLPVPLFFGGLPIHVAVMFIGFFGAMWIGGWAGKAKLEKEGNFDYEDYEELYAHDFSRAGRALGQSEEEMRHAMTKTLLQMDADKCLQKLVCYLEEQSDRSLEEELLLKLFPVAECITSSYSRCTAKGVQLRGLMHYYQTMETKKTLSSLQKEQL